MKQVAFLISGDMVEGRDGAREDVYEFQLEFDQLQPACIETGIDLQPVVWDEVETIEPFDAIVIGTAWDYVEKAASFLSTLQDFEAHRPVFNSSRVVQWNASKTYLRTLSEAGVATVPTLWVDQVTPDTVVNAFSGFETDAVVAKPVVGASAWRQAVIRQGESFPDHDDLPPGTAMIQPFLETVREEGEFSFLFFGDAFSHVSRKIPGQGDYRVQSIFGGREQAYTPTDNEISHARSIIREAARQCGEETFVYGRVDLIRDGRGGFYLMELELIEPYLYPEQGPDMGPLFARALAGRLGL